MSFEPGKKKPGTYRGTFPHDRSAISMAFFSSAVDPIAQYRKFTSESGVIDVLAKKKGYSKGRSEFSGRQATVQSQWTLLPVLGS